MTANEIVQPFLNEPWLDYTSAEPSGYAVNIGLPEALKRAEEYPFKPGITLDFMDDTTHDGELREDIIVPASGQKLYHYRDAQPRHPDDPRIVYYVHGGGFMRGNDHYCRSMGIWSLRETGLPVYAAEYRLAPEHKWPANLDDVEAAFNYLVEDLGHDPAKIITIGDSAGGTLTAALGMRLKRLGRSLPGQMAFLSPALDYTLTLPAHQVNAYTDPLFYGGLSKDSVNLWSSLDKVMDPEMSPLHGDWTGFPPLYFSAGELEILLSDSVESAKKAYDQGVEVTCHVFHGMWHDWVTNDYEIPESYVVGADIRKFIGLPRTGE
ncbi:MAG: alpha/beta hydrolase [Propionibacteriaceae bacterium]|jgi:acetyl esterase/lipase|nr:alpha/beta hydrolase [Propionibacteriaceae bacterium]